MVVINAMELMSELKWWLNATISPISMVLNTMLFFLIKNKSSPSLENYKKVLYLGCVTDFFYALWNFLAEPDVTTIDGIYFTFTRGVPGYLPFPWSAWTCPLTLFFIYFSVVNVCIQFVYRYLLICWKIIISKWIFLSLVGFGASAVISYCMFFVYYLITREVDDHYYAHLLEGTDWMVNGKIPYFGAIPVAAFVNGFYISYPIVFVSYVVVIFSGIEIFRKIKKSEDLLNVDIKRYQRQITCLHSLDRERSFFALEVFKFCFGATALRRGIETNECTVSSEKRKSL